MACQQALAMHNIRKRNEIVNENQYFKQSGSAAIKPPRGKITPAKAATLRDG